ncbi:MAG TPA: di-heme oxidoredictase family protein [Kofleriaceae bacterium]
MSTGCSGDDASAPLPDAPSTIINAVDVPLDGLSSDDVAKFNDGDEQFGLPFRPADGQGPLFIRSSCAACHAEAKRGPGLVQKMVVVDTDGQTPLLDQSALTFGHTIRKGLAAGAMTPIDAPMGVNVKTSIRIGPPVPGRGYIEAIADSEIERVAAEQAQRTDGIHGVINRVVFQSVPNPDTTYGTLHTGDTVIGRFGMKARIATVDEFTADAFQGDMGMTTPMRPTELPNPDNLTDDQRPGVDLPQDKVDRVAFYVRHIAIPKRVGLTDRGSALFEAAACSACHVPAMHTRADYPITQLADIDAPVYSDLLLHDMGAELADGMVETNATGSMWKTTALIGLRFYTSFMHDGRAHDVAEAIKAHGGEASGSLTAFSTMSPDDQQALIQFVEAL